jgi:hypothetical protein
MTAKRILVQWIGHSDLRAMAASLQPAQRDEIMEVVKGERPKQGDLGPVKTLLSTQQFDEIFLLTNYPSAWNKRYVAWLGTKAEVVPADLKKPTDYQAIFRIADKAFSAIRGRKDWTQIELCLHLSPGTPAMAAVWLLLGKTRYPATFYETFAGESWITEVPFDLTIDVLPEILKNPDSHLQHLASQSPSEIEGFGDIVGDSRTIRDAVGRAKRAAVRGVTVLLSGESGTGKEMFAQARLLRVLQSLPGESPTIRMIRRLDNLDYAAPATRRQGRHPRDRTASARPDQPKLSDRGAELPAQTAFWFRNRICEETRLAGKRTAIA